MRLVGHARELQAGVAHRVADRPSTSGIKRRVQAVDLRVFGSDRWRALRRTAVVRMHPLRSAARARCGSDSPSPCRHSRPLPRATVVQRVELREHAVQAGGEIVGGVDHRAVEVDDRGCGCGPVNFGAGMDAVMRASGLAADMLASSARIFVDHVLVVRLAEDRRARDERVGAGRARSRAMLSTFTPPSTSSRISRPASVRVDARARLAQLVAAPRE